MYTVLQFLTSPEVITRKPNRQRSDRTGKLREAQASDAKGATSG